MSISFYDNKGQIDVSFATGEKETDENEKPVLIKMIFTAYSGNSQINHLYHTTA
jgi:hypothetical protein